MLLSSWQTCLKSPGPCLWGFASSLVPGLSCRVWDVSGEQSLPRFASWPLEPGGAQRVYLICQGTCFCMYTLVWSWFMSVEFKALQIKPCCWWQEGPHCWMWAIIGQSGFLVQPDPCDTLLDSGECPVNSLTWGIWDFVLLGLGKISNYFGFPFNAGKRDVMDKG